MANLLGQNIGTNYKGILNLNTLNGNLSGTLQAVTDGDGNASPLQLSTSSSLISTPDVGFFVGSSIVEIRRNTLNYFRSVNAAASAFVDLQFDVRNAYYQFNAGNGLGLGITSGASARLHVRGDGTNPIARFENNAGTMLFGVNNDLNLQLGAGNVTFGATNDSLNYSSSGNAFLFRSNVSTSPSLHSFTIRNINTIAATSSVLGGILLDMGTFAAAAGSANFRPLNIAYTINNSGAQTGTATGIFLNATETALNGMGHNLMDLQVGGVSRFRVERDGAVISAGGTSVFPVARMGFINDPTNAVSVFSFANTTGATTFGGSIFRFNLATNAAPALKRNGAALEVRLADDSGFAGLTANTLSLLGGNIVFNNAQNLIANIGAGAPGLEVRANGSSSVGLDVRGSSTTTNNIQRWLNSSSTTLAFVDGTGGAMFGGSSINASAILQADSTTKGFLPPRMTTAQRDLIATPAAGLMIYNTSTNRPNFYDGSAWVAL